MYTFYIEILHMLSDFAEADIDVWAMPSAAQLALPETGTMGPPTATEGVPVKMA